MRDQIRTAKPNLTPESSQRRSVGRFAELLERTLADLSDPLACHTHQCTDLLERHGVRALLETVVQVKNLALARRQVLPENAIDEFAHQVEVRDVFDLAAIDTGEPLAQSAGFTI